MKVFIADDSAVVLERLVEMLSELSGIEIVGQARGGLEAINAITKLKPDAVILDIRMPDGSGIYVLRCIKKGHTAPVVIMLTSYPYPQYRKICLDEGADFFFYKSNEFDYLHSSLRWDEKQIRFVQLTDLFDFHRLLIVHRLSSIFSLPSSLVRRPS